MSVRFGLWYDFRNPKQFPQDPVKLYQGILDQVVRGEAMGWDDVWLSEHHFADDAYTPSPLTIAAAIAARTKTMRIGTSVMLLPLHDPVRIAEDAATVDILSNGRMDLGVGLGYAPHEFAAFGIPYKERRKTYEDKLDLLARILAGETYDSPARKGIKLEPMPVQKPMRLWVGGSAPAALERAAKMGANYIGVSSNLEPIEQYRKALTAAGRNPADYEVGAGFGGFQWLHVSNDPDKRWQEAEKHFLWQYELYTRWVREGGGEAPAPKTGDDLRQQGVAIVRPAEAIAKISEFIARSGVTRYYQWTLPPGLPPEWSDESNELMAKEVIPAVKAGLLAHK